MNGAYNNMGKDVKVLSTAVAARYRMVQINKEFVPGMKRDVQSTVRRLIPSTSVVVETSRQRGKGSLCLHLRKVLLK